MRLRSAAGRVRSGVLQLMVLLALATGLPGEATVLCIGPGGHVAFEPATVGSPAAALPDRCGTEGPGDSVTGCGCQDPCGPCRDVRLGAGSGDARLSKPLEPDSRAALACVPHGAPASAPAARPDGAAVPLVSPPRVPPHLAQSVILLI